MKIKNLAFFLAIAISLSITSCDSKKPKTLPDESTEEQGAQVNNSRVKRIATKLVFDTLDKSGPVKNLPWVDDIEFQETQDRNEANILLAAYSAVLKDPLPGEEFNVHLAAQSLVGIVIQPGEVFSQNSSIGPYIEAKGYKEGPTYIGTKLTKTVGGGVCKVASVLYNVSILSDLQIVERTNHGMPVPYVPYGQDATVAYGIKDFKFKNDKDFPILIWATGMDNRLYIGFYGAQESPKVEWHHEVLEIRVAPKQYKINPDLKDGEEKIVLQGMDGARVKSHITIEYLDGTVKTKDLGISSYKAMPFLVEKSK